MVERMALTTVARAGSRSSLLVLSALALTWSATPLFGQNPAPAPNEALDTAGEDENGEALQGEAAATSRAEKPVDPRVILREERERRERIDRLSRSQPTVEREGAFLGGPNLPDRLRPGRGLTYGGFVIAPSITLGALYSDNANSDDDDPEDDIVLGTSATVSADALLRRHAYGFNATVTNGYSVEDVEGDFFEWEAGASGRFDFTRQHSVNTVATVGFVEESDRSADDEGNDLTADTYAAGGGYGYNGRHLEVSLDALVSREDFSGEGSAERDLTTYTLTPRVIRQLSDRLALFIAPEAALNEFDDVGEGGDLDSLETNAVIGIDFQPRPRLSIGGSVGYGRTFFESSDVDDESSVIGALDIRYTYDDRTEFGLSANREIGVTTVDDAATETSTLGAIEMLRQVAPRHTISTQVSYTNNDFDNGARIDQDIAASLDYFFEFNRSVVFNLGYQYFTRFSDVDEEEFDENQILVGVTIAY